MNSDKHHATTFFQEYFCNISALLWRAQLTQSLTWHCHILWPGSVGPGWLVSQQINLPMAISDALTSDIFAAP